MKLGDFWCWDFEPDLTEISEILCSECGEWSHMKDWYEGSLPCQDCGSHRTTVCPLCDHGHDHVWAEPFKTRKGKTM